MGLANGELSDEENDYDILGEIENKVQGIRGRSDSTAKSLKSSERLNEELGV